MGNNNMHNTGRVSCVYFSRLCTFTNIAPFYLANIKNCPLKSVLLNSTTLSTRVGIGIWRRRRNNKNCENKKVNCLIICLSIFDEYNQQQSRTAENNITRESVRLSSYKTRTTMTITSHYEAR